MSLPTVSSDECVSTVMGDPNSTANDSSGFQRYSDVTVLAWTVTFSGLYFLICVLGIVGNGLVIFVVIRYTKMKTVTNMYILNLAVADLCFLVGLPFLIVTMNMQRWLFGFHMCKLFLVLTSINWFTSVFTLCVMSADRYMAVCHPVRSMQYRTPFTSRIVCVCVWTASLLVMIPIMMYAKGKDGSCTIEWPTNQVLSPQTAFIWYTMLLGFAIPVALISVFYALVIARLKTVGPRNKSKEKKRSHRKVTKMILTVIAVYVVCWLPYWVFQVTLTFVDMPMWHVPVFQGITVLSYANSMINPIVYAFLSDNFRKAFLKAFKCAAPAEVNGALMAEQSVFPGKGRSGNAAKTHFSTANSEEEIEFTTNTTNVGKSTSIVKPTTKFEKDSDGVHVVVANNCHPEKDDPPPATV